MGFQSTFAPRILVIERDETLRSRLAACAKEVSDFTRVRSVASLEWAVDILQREEFDLILIASDLGRGTQAFTSAVTLMGAGTRALIAVHTRSLNHSEGLALESIGIGNYRAADAIDAGVIRSLVAPTEHAAVA